jgi:YbbR domain-containing protein
MTVLRRVAAMTAHNWPQKLGALVLAFGMWYFVTSSSVTTTQRSLLVTLTTEGVLQSQVAVGIPQVVEVNVSGPSSRVDRLRPDSITASLDLSGLNGEFQQQVNVQTPNGIHLVNVSPSHVIGFLETVGNRDMTVTVALSGAPPSGSLLSLTANPTKVTLTGQEQVLQKVAKVMAVVPAREGQAQAHPFPVDDAGVPVQNVKVAPSSISVQVTARQALVTKRVPIAFSAPIATNLSAATLDQQDVVIAGPPDELASIETVKATVQPPTPPVAPGRYTLPVALDLPQGVSALSSPTVELRYASPPRKP